MCVCEREVWGCAICERMEDMCKRFKCKKSARMSVKKGSGEGEKVKSVAERARRWCKKE